MIEVYERTMNAAERKLLEKNLADQPQSLPARALNWALYWLWCLGLLALAGAVATAMWTLLMDARWNPWIVPITLVTFGPFLVFPAWVLWKSLRAPGENRRFEQEFRQAVRARLQNGRVKATRVTADRVIVVNQFEDEGEAMIFAVGERQSLILHRQHVGPEDPDADWPAAEFEIVRAAYDNEELGILATRGVLTPALEIDWTQFEDETVFINLQVDETIVDLTPEEVIAGWGFDPSKESAIGDFLS